jgi:Plant transposon protein
MLDATTDQKICVALRLLGQGIGADSVIEVSRLSESTSAKCHKQFCAAVVDAIGDQYLRLPSADNLKRTEATYSKLGLPGCIGAVDCAGWQWSARPVAEQGLHRGKDRKPTLCLEAWCDDILWIWLLFFGMLGSHIGNNTMNTSSLFQSMRVGKFPPRLPRHKRCRSRPLVVSFSRRRYIHPLRIFLTAYTRRENSKQKCFREFKKVHARPVCCALLKVGRPLSPRKGMARRRLAVYLDVSHTS